MSIAIVDVFRGMVTSHVPRYGYDLAYQKIGAACYSEDCTLTLSKEKTRFMKQDNQHPLSEEAYDVLRCGGTEAPFTGNYYQHHEDGTYACAGCGAALFLSKDKFDSGSGWPSFDRPMDTDAVVIQEDDSHGMRRLEVVCKACGGHLGHVFPDGPQETTGQRFCVNSVALSFQKPNQDAGIE